jgi:hypothetical protein
LTGQLLRVFGRITELGYEITVTMLKSRQAWKAIIDLLRGQQTWGAR